MLKFIKKILIFSSIAVVILIIFGSGFLLGRLTVEPKIIFGVSNAESGKPADADFSLFWDSWYAIENKYVGKENLNYQEMLYGAISGMVRSLSDPYTVFFPPAESKRFEEEVSGFFEGVGMEMGIKKGDLIVISPLENTPAQKAGLRAGDKIIKVNDTDTESITIDEAVSLIRGPKGTEVRLTILREGWSEPREFVLVRDVIEIPSLKLEFKNDKEGKPSIAYLKLYFFSKKADADFENAADKILRSPAEKIILDLRNNPGGYLEIAQSIAGWFLEKGQLVVTEDFGAEKEQKPYKAKGNEKLISYPIVVLINKGSASGAEILAGALKDNRGIKLIGEQSFGKGSVQEVEELKSGASIKITVAKWLTPGGKSISDVGIEPDIKVEMTNEDIENGRDPQLDKAIEIIQGL